MAQRPELSGDRNREVGPGRQDNDTDVTGPKAYKNDIPVLDTEGTGRELDGNSTGT